MGYRARGSHRYICDKCRLEYNTATHPKRKEWTGAIVCGECWDARPIEDLYRAVTEDTSVPDPRPDNSIYSTATVCTAESRSGRVGDAVVGCSLVGLKPGL